MKIILNPVRMDMPLTLARAGDVLTFNGQPVDIAAGETCYWIVGQPVLGPEGWEVEIILPHAADAAEETRFPAPITLGGDGPVDLPPWGHAAEEIASPGDAPAGPEGWTTHD